MTDRERFLATMEYQAADRFPQWELGIWGQTLERWLGEGMPSDQFYFNWFEGEPYFGFDRRGFVYINVAMVPPFDVETIEENERYVITRHSTGYVTKALKEGTVRGTRPSMDQYLDFPVKTREDFLHVKERYDPSSPIRYPLWWEEHVETWKRRDYPLILLGNGSYGLYWTLRQWMGTENLSYAFFDQAALVEEMLDFIAEFLIEVTRRAVTETDIDYFNFSEDFAGKGGPLISPAIFRKFFMPRYKRIIEHLRKDGIRYFFLDSDGDLEVLIPLLLECGINCLWPLEIASGMEPVDLRRKFGRDLRFCGGIDKRELTKDKKSIEREVLRKVPQLVEEGGYIPHLDHTFPPDISYENFLYYLELKQKVAEGGFGR